MKASGWKIKTQSGTEKGETSAVEGFHWIPKESWKENVEIPSLHEFNPEIFERERKWYWLDKICGHARISLCGDLRQRSVREYLFLRQRSAPRGVQTIYGWQPSAARNNHCFCRRNDRVAVFFEVSDCGFSC